MTMDNQGFNESTKSKQFNSKIHGLVELCKKLEENKSGNVLNVKDITHVLSYFDPILLAWVKNNTTYLDVANYSFDRGKFPLADYELLLETLLKLVTNSKNIDDEDLSTSILKTLKCLIPFVETTEILLIPTILSEQLYVVPHEMQLKIVDLLVQYLIPLIFSSFTQNINDESEEINLSIPGILANILDSSTDPSIWSRIMECLMRFKINVSQDLLAVLAYGTKESLEASVHLLNRYFPPVDIASVKAYNSPAYDNISTFLCQAPDCKSNHEKDAVKVLLDPSLCSYLVDSPPPYYLCQKCYEYYQTCRYESPLYLDVVQPVGLVSQFCDNVDCRFGFMKSVYFCFSLGCIKKNGNKPMRLCEDCHLRLHADVESPHMNHQCLKELWTTPNPQQSHLVDAIVRLWNEAQPDYQKKCSEMGIELDNLFISEKTDQVPFLTKTFRSLHGLWLLKTTCPIPPKEYHLEHLGRLLGMLFVWVESVEYATHAQVVQVVGQSRLQAINWIKKVLDYDHDLFCSCLFPNPPLYARVGHPWTMLTSVVRKDLEILQRIVTLTKHNLLPEKVWDHVMPIWIQELKASIPVDEIKVFKKVLGQLFDKTSELRPSYAINFIKKRLESSIIKQSQEGLVWVQILSFLDVQMDIEILLEMFIDMFISKDESSQSGSNMDLTTTSVFPFPSKETLHRALSGGRLSRQNSAGSTTHPQHASPLTSPTIENVPILNNVNDDISISILIMDVLIKQLTLQKQNFGEVVLEEKESMRLNLLLVCTLDQSFNGQHSDHILIECSHCQLMNVIFYQISLLVDLAVKDQVTFGPKTSIDYATSIIIRKSSSLNSSKTSRSSQLSHQSKQEEDKLNAEKVREELLINELVKIVERRKKLQVMSSGNLKYEGLILPIDMSEINNVIFAIPELQIMQFLLQQLCLYHETSVTIHILSGLEVLCLRGECLEMVATKDLELLQKIQTIMFVPCLWELLRSSSSNIAQRVVPLLLHCACLPYGAEQICCEMERDFTDDDWRVRFAAAEKIGLICQFLNEESITDSQLAQSVVVHGIAYLCYCVQDIVILVASKAKNMVQNIRISSLKLIYQYLDNHFDFIDEDRLSLVYIYQTIHSILPTMSPLTVAFFINIFKKVKKFDRKEKQKKLFKWQTIMTDSEIPKNHNIIAIYSRRLVKSKEGIGGRVSLKKFGQVSANPLMLYRNQYTLQAGKSWRDGVSNKKSQSFNILPTEVSTTIENALDTVSEENESESGNSFSFQGTTVTGQTGLLEDEVNSVLIHMLMEFLSDKSKIKQKDKNGGKLFTYEEIRSIIDYLGIAMGFELTTIDNDLRKPKRFTIQKFRKNSVFVAFLMNLPKLLDGCKEHGEYFIPLALVTMETCIKQNKDDNILLSRTTLMRIGSSLRYAWLSSLIIIMYKYPFGDWRDSIWSLVNVVKNTIDSHGYHICNHNIAEEHLTLSNIVSIKSKAKKIKWKLNHSKADETEQYNKSQDIELNEIKLTESPKEDNDDKRSSRPMSEASLALEETTEDMLLDVIFKDCPRCRLPLFQYEEECINLCMISLVTLVHLDATMAAPFIIDVVETVARKASVKSVEHGGAYKYPNLVTNSQLGLNPIAGVAQQFLRCVFYQLAPSRLFPEMFRVEDHCEDFFLIMSTLLQDFGYLTQLCPLKLCLSDFNESKSNDRILIFLNNLTLYVKQMVTYTHNTWEALQNIFETFFKTVINLIPAGSNMDCLLDLMSELLFNHKQVFKFHVELMEDIMSHIIKNCLFSVRALKKLCNACIEAFGKGRNQMKFVRRICLTLTLVISSKTSLPDHAIIELLQFFADDVGTNIRQQNVDDTPTNLNYIKAFEHIDMNFSAEVIDYLKSPCRRLKDRTEVSKSSMDHFHSFVKLSISQISAIYVARLDVGKESRIQMKISSFLTNFTEAYGDRVNRQTSSTMDIQELLPHCYIFAWTLLGSINHANLTGRSIPHLFPLSNIIIMAEFIQDILQALVNESEEDFRKHKCKSQLHLSFLLSQIVSVYLELHLYEHHQSLDASPLSIIKDFWSRLTPIIYSLLCHSAKIKTETVVLFSSMVQSISQQCPKTFSQMYPLWNPMLQLYINEIPGNIIQHINVKSHHDNYYKVTDHLLSQWVNDMQAQLWNIERMSKGRNIGLLVTA